MKNQRCPLLPPPLSGHHLAVGEEPPPALGRTGAGALRELRSVCLLLSGPRLWLEKNYICGLLFVLRRVQCSICFPLCAPR